MRPDDPKLKRLEPPKLTLAEQIVPPADPRRAGGHRPAHPRRRRSQDKAITVQYPEEQHVAAAQSTGASIG